ncbi:MAG: type 2 isopentenyl-diphosphate Delta-isomerase [Firmicutes bacterium]|nr:type 2 isopentenyl-diphosphate Delta-isomerase [Bacillota bacterium]
MRKKRKREHLQLICDLADGPDTNGFEDIHFVPNCLPGINPDEIDTAVVFCGKRLQVPFLINAITGGIPEAVAMNRALARVARRLGIPLAVGSQAAALQDKSCRPSYAVVREENPAGFILANLSCAVSVQEALEAVEMIEADALQLHLNAAQEAMMPGGEGDLCFRDYRQKIKLLAKTLPVPVVVKETGCGIAREQALELLDTGIAALDVGGKGGANFILVESCRSKQDYGQPFSRWGLSTAVSLIEVLKSVGTQLDVVAAGGIRNGLEAAKALSLGAKLVGVAAPLVRNFYRRGEQAVENCLLQFRRQLQQTMLLLGVCNWAELQQRPLVILGDTGKWLERRGLDPGCFARRKPSA